ncbi:conserved hypothetical protein [Hahella chejuensis KCTC 2396]|uniref:Uncharacterized protein n=2 Tax=Hahella chejuensis TaxID=158327 RepID=Q2S7P9_HAHCH|nr:conserved hypothetical protein [Hahella chejuensis KCTC 2396]
MPSMRTFSSVACGASRRCVTAFHVVFLSRWRWALIALFALLTAHQPAFARDPCDAISLLEQQWRVRLAESQRDLASFTALRRGEVEPGFQLSHLTPVALDDDSAVEDYIQVLRSDGYLPMSPPGLDQCARLAKSMQTLRAELTAQLTQLRDARLTLFTQSADIRWALQRLLLKLERLQPLTAELTQRQAGAQNVGPDAPGAAQTPASPETGKTATEAEAQAEAVRRAAAVERLTEMSQRAQALLAELSAHLYADASFGTLETLWPQILTLSGNPVRELAAQLPDLQTRPQTLAEAIEVLRVQATYLRNHRIAADGMRAAMRTWREPQREWTGLRQELVMLPEMTLNALVGPVVEEYQLARERQKLVTLLSLWSLQVILLALAAWLVARAAAWSMQALSQLQRRLLRLLGQTAAMRLVNGLFWVLKPNAPWLMIWWLSVTLSNLSPSHWYLFHLLRPLGVAYALFRGIRVMSEWLFSRMYGQSGFFVTQQTGDQLRTEAGRLAVSVVVCWALREMALATGGGYVYFIVQSAVILYLWCLATLSLRRHGDVCRKFICRLSTVNSRESCSLLLDRPWIFPWWPLLFIAAQVWDLLLRLHLLLGQFDAYRSLSVRILRLHLETATGAETEGEDAEADEYQARSYRYWMLDRPREEQAVIAQEALLATLTKPVTDWAEKQREDNMLLLVGEHGGGKTSLVSQFEKHWDKTPVRFLSAPPKLTSAEAVKAFLTDSTALSDGDSMADKAAAPSAQKKVVIVDQAENFLLAQVGALDGVKAFLQHLNDASPDTFWIVVMHAPTWRYLSRVFQKHHQFSHIIAMPKWSPTDIRKLLLSRHHASHRRLRYDDLLLSALAGTESASFKAADTRVFNLMWELSAGNPLTALHLWLESARFDHRTVEIGIPQRVATSVLNALQDDECFMLAAVIQHENLTPQEIAVATTLPLAMVRQTLKSGCAAGILWGDERDRYRVHALWYPALTTYLGRKNILHG